MVVGSNVGEGGHLPIPFFLFLVGRWEGGGDYIN